MEVPLSKVVDRYRTELNDLTHNWIVHRVMLAQMEEQLAQKDARILELEQELRAREEDNG